MDDEKFLDIFVQEIGRGQKKKSNLHHAVQGPLQASRKAARHQERDAGDASSCERKSESVKKGRGGALQLWGRKMRGGRGRAIGRMKKKSAMRFLVAGL